ncbi:MAG: hypothetical protein ACOCRX_11595 [Candidatus Woesearchaeota archaeon]
MSKMKICPNCEKSDIEDYDEFCYNCGYSFKKNNSSEINSKKELNDKISLLEDRLEELTKKVEKRKKELKVYDDSFNNIKKELEEKKEKLDQKEENLSKREDELNEWHQELLNLQTSILDDKKNIEDEEFRVYLREKLKLMDNNDKNNQINISDDDYNMKKNSNISEIYSLISLTRDLISNNQYKEAKKLYKEIEEKYNDSILPDYEKKFLNLHIMELYNDINLGSIVGRRF